MRRFRLTCRALMVIVALYALLAQILKNEYDLSQRAAEFALTARTHR